MIESIKNDILKIYDEIIEKGQLSGMGYPNHDIFQNRLKEIATKYNLTYQTEYVGKKFFDVDKGKYKSGRIDIVYFKYNEPYMALEIDMGLKGSSIKKLVANDDFKYRIWFCYNRKVNTKDYFDLINRLDTKKEIIYLTKNTWVRKSKR